MRGQQICKSRDKHQVGQCYFWFLWMLGNDVVKLCLPSHCDINAVDVETEVPSELHRALQTKWTRAEMGQWKCPRNPWQHLLISPAVILTLQSHGEGHRNNDQFAIHRLTFRRHNNDDNVTAISPHPKFVKVVSHLLWLAGIKALLTNTNLTDSTKLQ